LKYFFHEKMVVILCVLTVFLGVLCAYNNKIQLLPNVEPPKISFFVIWPGASENFLITDVVQPYEEAILGRLERLESLKVTTRPERASFEVTFSFGTNLEEAESKLAALLSRARTLPLNVKPLTFHHGGTNVSNRVVGSYFITSESSEFSPKQLSVISNLAKQKFKLLPGVESVELNPALESQLQIRLDMNKLYQLNLSFDAIRQIVGGLLTQPVIQLYENERVITAKFKPTTLLEDIRQIPIAHVDGVSILLQDVAQVEVGPITQTAVSRFNGQEAIAMRILRYADANLIEVQKKVDEVLAQEAVTLDSAGLIYNLSFDTSIFIERAIFWIIGSLATGFILTTFVSYCFFRRFKPTILATLVILLSTCGVLIVLYLTKTSINVISLAGITFATGMFVDGVLIIVEYLDRLKPDKRSSLERTRSSLNKLVPALLVSTITTVIVFIPIIFSQGAESQLFKGLSLVIASGLLFALFFTVLLVPFFAEYFGQPEPRSEIAFPFVTNAVRSLIKSKRSSVFFVIFLVGGSLLSLSIFIPSLSYLPSVKRDTVDVYIPLSGDLRIETVQHNIVGPINDILQAVPSEIIVKNNYVIAWPHFATAAVRLNDSKQIPALIPYLQQSLKEHLPSNRVLVLQGELLGGLESANDIEINLYVSDQQWLAENISIVRNIIESALPDISIRVIPDVERFVKEYEFSPNLLSLRDSGITNDELTNLFRTIGKSDFIGKWKSDDEVVNAYITIEDNYQDVANIPYVSRNGVRTYMGSLTNIKTSDVLPSLNRLNGSAALTISLRPTSNERTVSSVLAVLEQDVAPAIRQLMGDKGYIGIEGSASSLSKTKWFLALLLFFIVLSFIVILAFLFRSIKLSMYVLLSLIPALAGGILAYNFLSFVTMSDFNVLTMLGFAIMLGIVANNSILLVDAANNVSAHCSDCDAILFAVNERVRAIVISSLTTVLGILPLLLFPSEASQLYQGIAAIIVGGIVVNLLTVLFLTAATIRIFGLERPTLGFPQNLEVEIVNKGL
jgi:multidrug efflux pump subunit AcrB